MQTTHRSPERRSLLRAAGTAVLTAAALGVAACAANAADPPAAAGAAPAIETYGTDLWRHAPLAAGSDGAMWSHEPRYVHGADGAGAIVRYGRSGVLSRAVSPVPSGTAQTPLAPQLDGGMAVVATPWIAGRPAPVRLHADARGRRVTAVRLPGSARMADAFAVAADGTVWWVDTCADALRRWRPGNPLLSVRMSPADCEGAAGSSELALGPDGAVWYVNTAQGRVVRRDARGKLRQWSFSAARQWSGAPELAVDPRGGSLAFAEPEGKTAGLVTRAGRLARTAEGAPAFGPRGTLWRAGDRELSFRRGNGESGESPLAPEHEGLAIAIGRDGRPWLTTGIFQNALSAGTFFHAVTIATSGDGLGGWPITMADRTATQSDDPTTPLTLGGDGALWTRVGFWGETAIVRVTPPGLSAPRRPVARVTGVLARSGRTVVLQVRCSAERGRFCRGTVGLGGSAKAVRYVAPGQSGAAVSLTLTGRAAARLRRAGALRLGAQVRSTGAGTTRATVRLRR